MGIIQVFLDVRQWLTSSWGTELQNYNHSKNRQLLAQRQFVICSNYCNNIPQARFAAMPEGLKERITSKFLDTRITQRSRYEIGVLISLYLSTLAKRHPTTSRSRPDHLTVDLSSSSSEEPPPPARKSCHTAAFPPPLPLPCLSSSICHQALHNTNSL